MASASDLSAPTSVDSFADPFPIIVWEFGLCPCPCLRLLSPPVPFLFYFLMLPQAGRPHTNSGPVLSPPLEGCPRSSMSIV